MTSPLDQFKGVWLGDFEFTQRPGELPIPICFVTKEVRTGHTLRLWEDELRTAHRPPFPTGPESLFISFYSSAEVACFLELGWTTPECIVDLFAEFRCLTNGRDVPCGNGLLGALLYFGLDAMDAVEKDSLQELAQRGAPFTPVEKATLLDYCESDVRALDKLLTCMAPQIDLPRAILRGRSMSVDATIGRNGVPVDVQIFNGFRQELHRIKAQLVERVDADFGVFVHKTPKVNRVASDNTMDEAGDADPCLQLSFSSALFEEWLARNGIPWPRLASGKLDLEDETFRQMARLCPAVAPLRELRHTLSQLRLNHLAVGADGRNRCFLSAFRASTSRSQPSNSKFIFGPSVWLRSLIRPEPGKALAYIDWSGQEVGVAAGLSGDKAMQTAYIADPYLWLAKAGKYAPSDATKKTHPEIRDVFKIVYLAANYGMGEKSLSQLIGRPQVYARELLRLHRQEFSTFWRWSDGVVAYAMLHGELWTTFGWHLYVGPDAKPTSLRNFLVQSNAAEMLRLACRLTTERGIAVAASVHDALLVEGLADEIDEVVVETERAMREASEIVLGGFALRTDAKIVRYPDRYRDPRGECMWRIVMEILASLSEQAAGVQGEGAVACSCCTTPEPILVL
jgi:hypothetical protein